MPLSWNEIRANAISFAKEWKGETREHAEGKTFWDDFFRVFGLRRRHIASFEEPVKTIKGTYKFIDLFWRGTLLVEHKSGGKSLDKAHSQGMEYIQRLQSAGRTDDVPRYLLVSDFLRFALYDLEAGASVTFELGDLYKHIHAFAFIPGYQQPSLIDQNPINISAAERLGSLRDALEDSGYKGHALERLLVRILFCLFADDTSIFDPRDTFALYIRNHTREDGSDLGPHLAEIFDLLDTPVDQRSKHIPEDLRGLPYVNGGLFAERLRIAHFNRATREALLHCSDFNWSTISPAIFGALFQSVLDARERRQFGAHYTWEPDIIKVVQSLFLDDLRNEFERIKHDRRRLAEFHAALGNMKFMDPACGCGSFLVIAYRELRQLELDVLQALSLGQRVTDISALARIDVDQFFGIETEEWPARIAEVAMWLTDHQMNLRVSELFGNYFVRLPLKKSPTIVVGNALCLDWRDVVPTEECSYILGNPPFVGHHYQNQQQKADQDSVLSGIPAHGVLDYVCNWYVKAADYIRGTRIEVAFVSTNSITQGEQVGLLWTFLIQKYGIKIHFAHRTFVWQSEARGKAHVHVVVIGFGAFDATNKRIYEYAPDGKLVSVSKATNICPYLVEGSDRVVVNRSLPVSTVPRMSWGNKPTDGGHLILSGQERDTLIAAEPGAGRYIRPYMSGGNFIDGITRYCLWLKDADPRELRKLPMVWDRVEKVKKFREDSKAPSTRAYAKYPTLFRQTAQPSSDYLAIPEVSSERRAYIPIGFMSKDIICSNKIQFVPGATLYHFGVLTSAMHMAWTRQVCGRLKSDISYSNTLVYNNFVWPESPTDKQSQAVIDCARAVLDARDAFPDATLADLYDPVGMPPALARAHAALDRAVDKCYRAQPFGSERQRFEFLFALYERCIAPLAPETTQKSRAKSPRRAARPTAKTQR